MKLLVDIPGFTMICATWSINCFCFDLHISAEQFYDRNKQELVKTINQHKLCHVKWWLKYWNNRSVSWRLSCKYQAKWVPDIFSDSDGMYISECPAMHCVRRFVMYVQYMYMILAFLSAQKCTCNKEVTSFTLFRNF